MITSNDDRPILQCKRLKKHPESVLTEKCPYCGKQHTHGAAGLVPGKKSHRSAHCEHPTQNSTKGYCIVLEE